MTRHRLLAAVALGCVIPVAAPAQTSTHTGPQVHPSTAPSEAGQTRTPALPTVTTYPSRATGDGATSAGYNPSRWAEDWSRYADPGKRDDPLDRLKFLPLTADNRAYLTLSGELRLRVNALSNPGLRDVPHQRQDISRLFAGADVHLGPVLRLYGELAHGWLSGRNLGAPNATMENDLIVQQAFAELHGEIAGLAVGGRYGRQEFTDGASTLISQRDNSTIRTVVNGLRGWVRSAQARADLFDLHPTIYGVEGTRDDDVDHQRRFSGVTAGFVVPPSVLGSQLFLDPFVWRLRNRAQSWGPRTGREERTYLGARLWGEAGQAVIDWTVDHQSGNSDGRPIDAWQVFAAQTYRLGKAGTAPRVGAHIDYASGGGAYDRGTLHAALSPYANGPYFSYALFLAPTNLLAAAGNITVSPIGRVRLTTEYQIVGRPAEDDAVYRSNGTPFAGTQQVAGHHVANVLRAELVWSVAPRVSVTGRYEHLQAGPALTRAGYADADFAAAWVSFRL